MQRFWALLGRCGSGTSSHNGATAPHPDPSYLPPQGIYRLLSSDSASFISYGAGYEERLHALAANMDRVCPG